MLLPTHQTPAEIGCFVPQVLVTTHASVGHSPLSRQTVGLCLDEFIVGEDVVEESGLTVLPPFHGLLEIPNFHTCTVSTQLSWVVRGNEGVAIALKAELGIPVEANERV